MFKLEYFKVDGTKSVTEHYTRKAAVLTGKRVGVDYAYITNPEGVREKVRFNTLPDSINPDTAALKMREARKPGSREWKRK